MKKRIPKGGFMTRANTLIVSFSLLALAGAPAYANQEPFDKLDKDADGRIGRIEAAADADAKSRFERLDANADGKLSREEYQRWNVAAGTHASALIGSDVVNRQGEELGEIQDLVIDLNGGKVHAAVLEFGGTLGMGEKHYAFPVSQLQPAKDTDQLVLNVDKQKLENAQGFAKGEWPAMNDEYWGRIGDESAASGATKAQELKLVLASEMIGKNVQAKNGSDVGEIKDLTLSLEDGSVRNVAVDLDDGGQAVLQASALTTGTDGEVLINLTQDQLEAQAKR
jgi:sporulation protein YlmC with PRC-barrel domain